MVQWPIWLFVYCFLDCLLFVGTESAISSHIVGRHLGIGDSCRCIHKSEAMQLESCLRYKITSAGRAPSRIGRYMKGTIYRL